LFSRLFLIKQQVNLAKAIEILGLGFDGTPHSALADARNTARVHAAIIRRMRREPDPRLLRNPHCVPVLCRVAIQIYGANAA
jgi:inhibitor of KinA sporulation pathway (predicted exonuclease)